MSSLKNKMGEIESLINNFSGEISFSLKEVNTNETLSFNEKKIRPTASVIKVLILGHLLLEVEKKRISLDEMIEMTPEHQERGTGILKDFTLGTKYKLRDIAMAMVVISDNTATNMIIDLLGGVNAVNNYIKQSGLNNTTLINRIEFNTVGDEATGIAVSTTEELLYYLNEVRENRIFSEAITNVFFDMMSKQQDLTQFGRYVPYNPYAKELNMKQDFYLANKTGTFPGVRCDVGYARNPKRNIIFSIFTEKSDDLRFNVNNENAILIGKIARIIMD